jgi:hypothetical protein
MSDEQRAFFSVSLAPIAAAASHTPFSSAHCPFLKLGKVAVKRENGMYVDHF